MRLEEQLDKMAAFGASLRNKGSIKKTLGISTKSYLHTGEIAGYADKVAVVSKAANLVKKGTYIGIALDVAATGLEIKRACTLGREDACRKASYIESASLAGSLSGTTGGAALGSFALAKICLAVGVPTGGLGALSCGVIGGAAGGMVGGELGKAAGKFTGEFLYETVEK